MDFIKHFKFDNAEDTKILEPFLHYAEVPGKQLRTKFARAVNLWFQVPDEKLQQIVEFLDVAHITCLLYDDIEDHSDLRRGIPTAHLVYGIHHTINAAKYAFFIMFEKNISEHDEKAVELMTDGIIEAHIGQGMDIYWRDNFICPSIEEYKRMVNQKSGTFFTLASKLMYLFSDYKFESMEFCRKVALYFQIRDDYFNLCSDQYAERKNFCDDISEGKFSFPVIHAIQNRPEDRRILDILKRKPEDLETKKYALSLLEEFGSLAYTKRVLDEMKDKLMKELKKLPENPTLNDFIEIDLLC